MGGDRLILAAIALAACAGASQTTAASRCALTSADSAYLKGGDIYRDCAVERRAQVLTRRQPEFRPDVSAGQSCYSATIEFVVDTTGSPEAEGPRVVRANHPNFAGRALA